MIEVEVKLPINNCEYVIETLNNRCYTKCGRLREEDVYFNGPDRDYRKTDEALRLRKQDILEGDNVGSATYITYKGKKLDKVSMARKELETVIGDFEVMREILISLGYKPVTPVIKIREVYSKDYLTVCVDNVEGLGYYIELEVCVEDESGREQALELIKNELEMLGYSMQDTTRVSYLSMLESKL